MERDRQAVWALLSFIPLNNISSSRCVDMPNEIIIQLFWNQGKLQFLRLRTDRETKNSRGCIILAYNVHLKAQRVNLIILHMAAFIKDKNHKQVMHSYLLHILPITVDRFINHTVYFTIRSCKEDQIFCNFSSSFPFDKCVVSMWR